MRSKIRSILALVAMMVAFVSCAPEKEAPLHVESLRLNTNSVTLKEGDQAKLEVSVSPINVTDYQLQWFVSDNTIATVSKEGLVTALKEGRTTVSVKAGGVFATCLVRVISQRIPLEGIAFDSKEASVVEGSDLMLTPKLTPEDATDQVEWSSSNTEIATVQNGRVTGVKPGDAIVRAYFGRIEATIIIHVIEKPVEVTSLKFVETRVSIEEGSSKKLEVKVESDDPDRVELEWFSSDDKVAKVSDGQVTGVSVGKATITVNYGDLKDECAVEVTEKKIVVKSLTLDKKELKLKELQSATITATIDPEEYLNQIKWRSEDEKVATVSQYGQVKAQAPGTTRIVASAGDKEATCTVTVAKALSADDFGLQVSKATPTDIQYTITTSSDDIYYVCDILPKFQYDDIVKKHGSKYIADKKWWDDYGDEAFKQDLKHGTYNGSIRDRYGLAYPDTQYVIYYYAVDKDTKELASPIIDKSVSTAESIPSDNQIAFIREDVLPTALIGKITTTNNDGYYVTIQKKTYVDQYLEKAKNGETIDGIDPEIYMFYSCIYGELQWVDIETIIRRGEFKLDAETFTPKRPKTDYVLMIIGYDLERGFSTKPVYYSFTTPPRTY